METWYRISWLSYNITPIEVHGETAKFVKVMAHGKVRVLAKCGSDRYFRTWEEARNALLDRAAKEIAAYEKKLAEAERASKAVAALTPPLWE